MSGVIEVSREVDHDLCRMCPHDKECRSVCIAIESLVQLAKVRSPLAQLEYIYNVGTRLDLDNSYTSKDL
ncbi:hypothetical protein [Paenibacillus harenae]|uniref:hypothetical protein n=1 Tax=Paenibacillus harenae TaxID=306543 RepID=UPI002794795E|nr:hypothetical protein [Paenibacillus harenae]MDQ0062377.1 hypothetical protein [Paenibacillus harenae]